MITLNAAPSLSTVAYYVDQPAGTLSAARTDWTEIVVGGVHTGVYQAPEPAAYAGILWTDGTVWEYQPSGAAAVTQAVLGQMVLQGQPAVDARRILGAAGL